jgi:hypothetical protein
MRDHGIRQVVRKGLDWLDRQPGLVFWVVLYLVRWPVIIPVSWFQGWLASLFLRAHELDGPLQPHLSMLIVPPLLETFIECTLPYWILSRLGKIPVGRPWGFIVLSGGLMALLHFPYALPCGFVTGVFLAYGYAHFAPRSQGLAFAATALFHAAINAAGFVWLQM